MNDDRSGFDAAVITVTTTLLKKVRQCAKLCTRYGLSETRFYVYSQDIQPFALGDWDVGRRTLERSTDPVCYFKTLKLPKTKCREYSGDYIMELVVYDRSLYWSLISRKGSGTWESPLLQISDLCHKYAHVHPGCRP